MGPEKVGPKQKLGDLDNGEGPLQMLFVEFQWDVVLPVGADAAPVGGSQLAAPVGGSQLRSLAVRASIHPGGGKKAYLCPCVD